MEKRPEDRIRLKVLDSLSVFQVQIDIASKTPKQEEDETDCYFRDEADENIQKHRSSTLSYKPSGQKEHEHPTATGNDVHQITEHSGTGHQKTWLKGQMTCVRLVNTDSLPPRGMDNVSQSTTGNLHVV